MGTSSSLNCKTASMYSTSPGRQTVGLFCFQVNELTTTARLEEIAVGIEAHTKTAAEQILYNGKLLCEARELLKSNNDFGEWRERRLPWLDRKMAFRWMEAWRNGGENLLGQNVPTTSVYLLTAPSVPESAREEALERAESGEKLTVKATEEIVARHKAELAAMEEGKIRGEKIPACGNAELRESFLNRHNPVTTEKALTGQSP